jgi:hypothetical protein
MLWGCDLLRFMKNRFEPAVITVYVVKEGKIVEQLREIPPMRINEVVERSGVSYTEKLGEVS